MRSLARVVAALVAAALAAAAILVLVEIVNAAFGAGHVVVPYDSWYRFARSHDWTSGEVRAVGAGLAVVGVLLLVLGLSPWRPDTIDAFADDSVDVAVKRRGVASSVQRAVERIDGVDRCAVRVTRSRVDVRAITHRRLPGSLGTAVDAAARARLGAIGLSDTPVRSRLVVKVPS